MDERIRDIIETSVDTVFEIEKQNIPRSKFSGIRNRKQNVKRTNRLRNTALKKEFSDDFHIKYSFDFSQAPYGKYINELNNYITYNYTDKIIDDAVKRIRKMLKEQITGLGGDVDD